MELYKEFIKEATNHKSKDLYNKHFNDLSRIEQDNVNSFFTAVTEYLKHKELKLYKQ